MIFRADRQLSTLLDFRYQQHYRAKRGQHGRGKNQEGRSAPDLLIPVPLGTIIRDEETGEVLKDFTREGETFIAAHGGSGGRGNARFATSTRQAPRFSEPGKPGESRRLLLELKLIADVGIVGFPNAGKSTLISKISAVKSKAADYPFTTLVPHLGMVQYKNSRPFVIADIPGIIEGAHEGVGLGLKFLRHVERTSLILHLLDMTAPGERNPVRDYETLNRELSLFNPEMARKPQILALNKMDDPAAEEKLPDVQRYFAKKKKEVFPISAVTGKGLSPLLAAVVKTLNQFSREKQVDETEDHPE